MTDLLVALILAVLQGKTIESLIREQAKLVDLNGDRLNEIIEENIISCFYTDPMMIPFWFLLNTKEIPAPVNRILIEHKNHTRSKLIMELITELRDVYRGQQEADYHENALSVINERVEDEECRYNLVDLLQRDFSDYCTLERGRIRNAFGTYHINEDRLRIAAQLFSGQD